MSVECFLDTNILVYAAAGRGTEEAKRRRALEIIENENFGISTQVLQEFYVTVVRKIDTPLSPEQALEWIEQFAYFPCLSIDVPIVKLGIEFSERYQISYWDGAILASAEALGATTLYSEDLNDGQFYNTVRLLNPFK
ncbi:MAG: PIN domain-containing protein [Anaerolineae bacterium]|nr:PIN domain-containing protein [Anaerolineae bacterium]MCI0652976.1 PIN domain-containing protein [Methylococcaceae bacterium]